MASMGAYISFDTGTTTSTSTVWTGWCTTGTNTISTTQTVCTSTTVVWYTWCDGATNTYTSPQLAQVNDRQAREDYARHMAARNAEATERYAESERKRKEAEARADKLLVENLTLQQRLDFEKTKSFMVKATSGKRYRIRCGRMGNVDMINAKGFIEHRLCAHPGVDVPNGDTMLAQKLMLEVDEPAFLRIANRHAVVNNAQIAEAIA